LGTARDLDHAPTARHPSGMSFENARRAVQVTMTACIIALQHAGLQPVPLVIATAGIIASTLLGQYLSRHRQR